MTTAAESFAPTPPTDHTVERPRLPEGVVLRTLPAHTDARGTVAEIFRNEWETGIAPVQWSMTTTGGGVLRGVHVHPRHDDYLCVVQGLLIVGLRDLRPGSPTEGLAVSLDLRGSALTALFIPHGVAHGVYSQQPSVYFLGTSHYYDPDDELGCHWSDPALELAWPFTSAVVSARDAELPPLREVLPRIPSWRQA
jgi:dTDP-4-dehydrorhamnose 3,5-epimerase